MKLKCYQLLSLTPNCSLEATKVPCDTFVDYLDKIYLWGLQKLTGTLRNWSTSIGLLKNSWIDTACTQCCQNLLEFDPTTNHLWRILFYHPKISEEVVSTSSVNSLLNTNTYSMYHDFTSTIMCFIVTLDPLVSLPCHFIISY